MGTAVKHFVCVFVGAPGPWQGAAAEAVVDAKTIAPNMIGATNA
jgi:hypothetical protein